MCVMIARVLVSAVAAAVASAAVAAEPGKPLEVLYITGGCCHDYEGQKKLITEGLAARARMNVTVVHEGGASMAHKVSIYSKPEWAKGYDVVFHNECFVHVKDVAFVKGIVAEHKRGVPAVLMHCAMHSYRTGTDDWFELCGIQSAGHGSHHSYTAKLIADHPILRGLPKEWKLPTEELYFCDKLFPSATPLAEAMSRDRKANQTVIWTHDFHGSRVFGTTIGHFNHTVQMPEFLDLLARGTLWAADKLQDDGMPVAELQVTAADSPKGR
jgi:type 1 glutamine amidotransferase